MFKKNIGLFLKAYINVDYVGSVMDRISITGYYTFVRANLTRWRRKKRLW